MGKALVEYARHFHFFKPSETKDLENDSEDSRHSGWLLDVSDFSAIPGRGVRCFLHGKCVLVSFLIFPRLAVQASISIFLIVVLKGFPSLLCILF